MTSSVYGHFFPNRIRIDGRRTAAHWQVLAMDGRAWVGTGHPMRKESALASTQAWVTGSTLKTITLAAALEERTITLDQRFGCGKRAIGGEIFHDASEGPSETLDCRGDRHAVKRGHVLRLRHARIGAPHAVGS